MPAEVGREAPALALCDQHGQAVSLADFRGESNVLVLFYPFAFTGVCTGELRVIRDELPTFAAAGVQVLAVSCDSMFSLRVFAETEGISFPLLSDFWPHGAAARAYGVFDQERGCALRGTFLVDKRGVLRWTVRNALPDARDVAEYHKAVADLGG